MTADEPGPQSGDVPNSPVSSSVAEAPDRVAPRAVSVSTHGKKDDNDDDDDVQFVSCISLHKEIECPKSSQLPLDGNQPSESAPKETPSTVASPLPQVSKQGSTEVSQQHKSDDIGHDESRTISERSEPSPKSAASADCTPNTKPSPSSPLLDSNSGAVLSGPLDSQKASSTPWTDFLYADQPETMSQGWRPVCFGDPPAAKGNRREECEDPALQSSHIPQVSPKTVHHMAASDLRDSSSGSASPAIIGSPRMGDAPQVTGLNDSMGNMWPNFAHSPRHHTGGIPGAQQVAPRSMNLTQDKTTWPMVSSYPQGSNNDWNALRPGLNGPSPTQTSRMPMNYVQSLANYSHFAATQSATGFKSIQKNKNQILAQDHTDPPFSPLTVSQNSLALYMNPASEMPSTFSRTPHDPHPIQAKASWMASKESTAANSNTESSNILRRPSLYSIPPWPARNPGTFTPFYSLSVPPNYVASDYPSITTRDASTARRNAYSPFYPGDDTRTRMLNNCQQNSIRNATSTGLGIGPPTGSATENSSDQLPRKRARHEYSPNLVVDIAETCQELFPFAEVAARHNKPIQRVIDTFSAIIQIPLLRNAEDRRRHGSLGKRRMREYRDAKKAMEKAHEAERRTQLPARRSSAGYVIERVKEPLANAAGHLKPTVLNRSREAQSDSGP
ncbi:uncharacterized protein BP5553_06781 [Venustampulla echinocandica]|uniref:Uncharacterized protein n=1 Tax=Venustampulla echinocandica TaxID=2656787 RepID=A0A370TKX0_9HELO|nr:uncharacterized protein BP5553_06781 [Venustampulla echinocandica]RDL36169.1 hypothetical protein BP5553_06781 [Venustampulla echinocandica]